MTKSIEEIFQDIQSNFDVLCEKMENLKEQIKSRESEGIKNERWKPEIGDEYYTNDCCGIPIKGWWKDKQLDNLCFRIGNLFKTEVEARQARDKMLIEQQLEDIATRLNNGTEIDWNDNCIKHCICYVHKTGKIVQETVHYLQCINAIYCYSDEFLETALAEIGEEKLKFYMGVE